MSTTPLPVPLPVPASPPLRARRIGAGIAVALALVTSGCAAGQKAATALEKPTLDGANADVGSIHLRAVALEAPTGSSPSYPAGSDVAVRVVLVNSADQDDQLTAISSPAASDWGAFASSAAASAVMSADASPSPSAAAASTPAATSPAATSPARTPKSGASKSGASKSGTSKSVTSSSVASSPSSTPAHLPTPMRSITIAAGGRVSWGVPDGRGVLLLLHTTKVLYPGSAVAITFTFANAGSVTVQVPVALSSSPNSSVLPAPASSDGEG